MLLLFFWPYAFEACSAPDGCLTSLAVYRVQLWIGKLHRSTKTNYSSLTLVFIMKAKAVLPLMLFVSLAKKAVGTKPKKVRIGFVFFSFLMSTATQTRGDRDPHRRTREEHRPHPRCKRVTGEAHRFSA